MNMQKLYLAVGQRIREHRTLRELSLQQLAEAIDLDPGFLGQIERGVGVPSLKTLAGIAEALHVPLGEFFRESGQGPSEDFVVREVTKLLQRRQPKDRKIVLHLVREMSKIGLKR